MGVVSSHTCYII